MLHCNMEPVMMQRKGKMATSIAPAAKERRFAAATGRPRSTIVRSIALTAILCGGCTQLPDISGMPLPKLNDDAPTTYRSLTDIPDPPPVTAPSTSEAAIGTLSQERGSTENAADQLRGEPFINPAPAAVQNPF
jgi:hypothetical protein